MNEFIELVSRMRSTQKAYFAERKKGNNVVAILDQSKKLEKEVDEWLKKNEEEKAGKQEKLF